MELYEEKYKRKKAFPVLLCMVSWYQIAIQPLLEIPNMLLILGVLSVTTAILECAEGEHCYFPMPPKEVLIVLLYVVLTYLLGFYNSPNPSYHATYGITVIEMSIFMVLVCYYHITRGNTDLLIKNFIILYTLMSVKFLVSPQIYSNHIEGIRYSYSTTMNPNSFAIGLSIALWCLLYLHTKKKLRRRFLTIPLIVIFLVVIFMTGSRKSLLASLICIVLWFLFCYIPDIGGDWRNKIIGGVLSTFILVLISSIVLSRTTDSMMLHRMRMLQGALSQESDRMSYYALGYEYLKQAPFVGYGFQGFASLNGGMYSHSTIVEVFVSSGIPLGILYFSMYGSILSKLISSLKITRRGWDLPVQREICLCLILMLVMVFYAFMINHLYDLNSFIVFGIIIMMTRKNYQKRYGLVKDNNGFS